MAKAPEGVPVIPLKELEEILYAEAGSIDAANVPGLMLVVVKKALEHAPNRSVKSAAALQRLKKELEGQVADGEEAQE